jgi:hypothetical protein
MFLFETRYEQSNKAKSKVMHVNNSQNSQGVFYFIWSCKVAKVFEAGEVCEYICGKCTKMDVEERHLYIILISLS